MEMLDGRRDRGIGFRRFVFDFTTCHTRTRFQLKIGIVDDVVGLKPLDEVLIGRHLHAKLKKPDLPTGELISISFPFVGE